MPSAMCSIDDSPYTQTDDGLLREHPFMPRAMPAAVVAARSW